MVVLALFLDLIDLTSVRGFDFNFDFIILFRKNGLIYISVSVLSSVFNLLSLVLTVGVTREI